MNENNTLKAQATNNYKINSVEVSTNGNKEIYFDVKWEGNKDLDYYELRVLDKNRDCLEVLAYASHTQRVIIKDHVLSLKGREVNTETIYIELGIAEYTDQGELVNWELLADYPPIKLNIYYEPHIFRKTIMEIR